LAKELGLKLSGEGVGGTAESSEHQTWMNLDMAALRRLLDLNSNALIAQSMLENGKTRVEAKRDLERVSTLMELVERVRMSMQFEDRAVIEFRVDFRGDFQGDANLQAEEESAK
jgi:hypothetical protein